VTAPYSRIYHSIVDDAKFATVYDDDRRLATWLRLLIVAEQAHPASAYIPVGTSRAAVLALVDAGLIDLGTGSRYRIHGLDAERGRRSDAARVGGMASGRSRAVEQPLNVRSTKTNLDETSKDETRRAEQSARESLPAEDGRDDLEAFMLITRKVPTTRQRALLDGLLDRHDLTGPKWAADIMLRHPDDPIGAVIEADKAWRAERIAEAQAAEVPKAIPRRSHGLPQSARDILAQMKELESERTQ
jgi:hypothetical protein